MKENIPPFLGGLAVGIPIGVLFLAEYVLEFAAEYPLLFIIGISVVMFVGGLVLGRRASPKPQKVRLTGRVFDFPQGAVMVETALRRVKSILPTKVVRSE